MEGCREVNSYKKDKLEGMEACVKMLVDEGKDLRSIFWIKEDEEGYHWFEVNYTLVLKGLSSWELYLAAPSYLQ